VQARLDAQRAGLLDAAGRVLSEHGYRGCSIAAVAAAAGVASGTVYNHFESKGALVGELFRRAVAREVEAVRSAVAPGSTAGERATALVETFAGRALKQPKLAYALLAEPVDPIVEQLRLEYRAQFRDVGVELITAGMRSGELPPQNAVVAASAVVGAIAEALVGPLAVGHTEPDTIPTLIAFVHRALGVTDADA
jgi:AcrR family transcriptional regulator